jgi:hypothetical protein
MNALQRFFVTQMIESRWADLSPVQCLAAYLYTVPDLQGLKRSHLFRARLRVLRLPTGATKCRSGHNRISEALTLRGVPRATRKRAPAPVCATKHPSHPRALDLGADHDPYAPLQDAAAVLRSCCRLPLPSLDGNRYACMLIGTGTCATQPTGRSIFVNSWQIILNCAMRPESCGCLAG